MMLQTDPPESPRRQPDIDSEYEVVVVGAGPAGCTVATLLARAGKRVLLLERSTVPRFHVGESLVPECYGTLNRLGVVETLNAMAFPKKYSVQFYSEGQKASAPFYFDEYKDHPSSRTWQVVRGEFDKLLLETAEAAGAVCRTDAQVLSVLFEGDDADVQRAKGVRVKIGRGEQRTEREILSTVVVDATGQSTFIANRLGLKKNDARLKKGTVWTYFRGAQRDSGRDEGATLILQTEGKRSWFWSIPLPDDITSIGCTGSMDYMFGDRRTAQQIFEGELNRCPALKKRLANATRETDFFTTKDFSYYATQASGDGWVLVGDALGFIDPVYSTGVFLALKSGELAADAIVAALEAGDVSAERLGNWQEGYREGVELFRKLVYAFYDPDFSFSRFLKKHPQYRSNLVDLLIGDVFKPNVGEMFSAMS